MMKHFFYCVYNKNLLSLFFLILFCGCESTEKDTLKIRIFNKTQSVVSNVVVEWGDKVHWGENELYFPEILPGKYIEFPIHTQPAETAEKRNIVFRYKWGVGINFCYTWDNDKYEYPDITFFYLADTGTENFYIQGKTIIDCTFSLAGPPRLPIYGITRKSPEEEQKILIRQMELWKSADHIEIRKTTPDSSVCKWIVLSGADRDAMLSCLLSLQIPQKTFDVHNHKKNRRYQSLLYEIRLLKNELPIAVLTLTNYNGIIIPELNTALLFSTHDGKKAEQTCDKILNNLFQKK